MNNLISSELNGKSTIPTILIFHLIDNHANFHINWMLFTI